jgi:hypothetical protein
MLTSCLLFALMHALDLVLNNTDESGGNFKGELLSRYCIGSMYCMR